VKDLYTISYPSHWELKLFPDGISMTAPAVGPNSDGREVLSVSVLSDRFSDLDEYFKGTINVTLPKTFNEFEKRAEGVEIINEVRFRWVEVRHKENTSATKLIYFSRVRDKIFILSGQAATVAYLKSREHFIKAIRSFRIAQVADSPCYTIRYGEADTIPKPLFSTAGLAEEITHDLKVPDSLKNRSGIVEIIFTINCRGESTDIRIMRTKDSNGKVPPNSFIDVVKKVFPLIRQKVRYRPGWKDGYYIDFHGGIRITFKNGEASLGP
jgi:hypothetical protein